MSDIAIKVENLSKKYLIGESKERYKTLRDSIAKFFTSPFHRFTNSPNRQEIWALKDVSFDIERGEVVGIIGRNGAGKTTLLKVLSRITEPTEGYAEIRGRVSSLLEVGTGFHPELTGRENIYLSGVILGMKKAEIKRKFDEIVAFAGIEKFIDTPVKHYSSGMYVRLAFAVAAHLEPEILLVDEVLAVGDIQFQKKCLGKMGDVAKGGRTVVYISHQMNQIRRLCERAVWLDAGQLQKIGPAAETVSAYEAAMSSFSPETVREGDDSYMVARFFKWEIVAPRNEQPNVLTSVGPVTLRFLLKVNRPLRNGIHGIALFNNDSQLMWGTAVYQLQLEPGVCEFLYEFSTLPVRPGVYYWQVSLYDEKGLVDNWYGIPEMVVTTEPVGHPLDMWQGVLNLPWKFRVR